MSCADHAGALVDEDRQRRRCSGRRGEAPRVEDGALLDSLFGFNVLKFNSHHINVSSNVWSTKCRLITCMSTQIRSNLRDESIKPN
jgi:hypothetical protein